MSTSLDSESKEKSIQAQSNTTITHALTSSQERRLTDHIDEKILEIQRQYKKRQASSSLRSLSSYIKAMYPLLTLVLMVPPIGTSAHLRASLLLRLTGDLLECIPGYEPDDFGRLLEMLTELDLGWLAVLRSQVWDSELRHGIDLVLPTDTIVQTSPISQTDRTRLRSLLMSGTDKLEEWLEEMVPLAETTDDTPEGVIEIREMFDDLFHYTLAEMGELHGAVS
ncbi:hypothetical protein BU17DRAFT_38792 [Hysterangium stoloniferum]|nr:hypothetical protein BU17DRAFT_38792 [Hysterangium stoloniferum]